MRSLLSSPGPNCHCFPPDSEETDRRIESALFSPTGIRDGGLFDSLAM